MSLKFRQDDFLKLVAPSGDYRYGYVKEAREAGDHLLICLHEEGDSKIAFDAQELERRGETPPDWNSAICSSEKRLLPLLAQGLTTNEIAEALSISPVTTRTHIRMLRIKLHLDDRSQLTAFSQGLQKMLKA